MSGLTDNWPIYLYVGAISLQIICAIYMVKYQPSLLGDVWDGLVTVQQSASHGVDGFKTSITDLMNEIAELV